ncbi:MAG: hypothetical protein WD022_09070 [Balneolaceae bacterium]
MKKIFLLSFFLFIPALILHAQTTVTFNIDLKAMMKDSTFIPGQDFIQVTGSLYPLGNRRAVRLKDEEPVDSVFTAEVEFSRRNNDENLKFNFEIVKPDELISEKGRRTITLTGQNIIIPPVGFNSFVR